MFWTFNMASYSLPLKPPTLAVEPIIPAFYSLSYENNYTESYKRLRGYIWLFYEVEIWS